MRMAWWPMTLRSTRLNPRNARHSTPTVRGPDPPACEYAGGSPRIVEVVAQARQVVEQKHVCHERTRPRQQSGQGQGVRPREGPHGEDGAQQGEPCKTTTSSSRTQRRYSFSEDATEGLVPTMAGRAARLPVAKWRCAPLVSERGSKYTPARTARYPHVTRCRRRPADLVSKVPPGCLIRSSTHRRFYAQLGFPRSSFRRRTGAERLDRRRSDGACRPPALQRGGRTVRRGRPGGGRRLRPRRWPSCPRSTAADGCFELASASFSWPLMKGCTRLPSCQPTSDGTNPAWQPPRCQRDRPL